VVEPAFGRIERSEASAAKTAGSLVLRKPDLQCGSEPRAQYSDDIVACCEAVDDLVWETTFLHGSGRRPGDDARRKFP
jgi:hypothetical protein